MTLVLYNPELDEIGEWNSCKWFNEYKPWTLTESLRNGWEVIGEL